MKGKIYLAGGGDAEQSFQADKKIFRNIKKILYVPLAWDSDETYESCREWFESMLLLHIGIEYSMIKNSTEEIKLTDFDLVYIGGGNTFKLLKELKESNLGNDLIDYLNKGGIIYGGSAGAIIWGNSIDICQLGTSSDKNNVKQNNTSGFNIINDYDIQCQYNDSELKIHQEYSKNTSKTILAIPEENIVEFDGSKFKVLGAKEIKLISNNNVENLN